MIDIFAEYQDSTYRLDRLIMNAVSVQKGSKATVQEKVNMPGT